MSGTVQDPTQWKDTTGARPPGQYNASAGSPGAYYWASSATGAITYEGSSFSGAAVLSAYTPTFGPGTAIKYSVDGGATWVEVSIGLSEGNVFATVSVPLNGLAAGELMVLPVISSGCAAAPVLVYIGAAADTDAGP